MARTKAEKATKKISDAVDRYAEDIGWDKMELILQYHAQDCREEQEAKVTVSDLDHDWL